jgi:hypothetical protein
MSLIFVLVIAVGAGAVTYSGGVEYSAGSGANQATIVVDFDFDNSFLFTYRWDSDATGWDALSSIDLAGALDIDSTDYGSGWGVFVSDFDYPDGVEYDYGAGANVGWAYYIGDNESWSLSGTGVSFRNLADGGWDSWVWTNYSEDWMITYRGPGGVPVPEPATLGLLALGALALRRARA